MRKAHSIPTIQDQNRRLSPIPGRISGTYYPAFRLAGSNGTCTINVLYAYPFYIGTVPARFDALVFDSLGTASSKFRIGMYTDNAGRPANLIVDSGQIDSSGSGKNVYSYSYTGDGTVWLVGVGQSVNPSVARVGAYGDERIGSGDPYATAFCGMAYSQTGITGAMPAVWGSTYTIVSAANSSPSLWLRAK